MRTPDPYATLRGCPLRSQLPHAYRVEARRRRPDRATCCRTSNAVALPSTRRPLRKPAFKFTPPENPSYSHQHKTSQIWISDRRVPTIKAHRN
ncbi:hypothetical protein Pcinc_031177 [Petrolisthes cinctipes]|uniref:Uncharacterized protein n=1 Tax=Petrolisthes cinctipes TaxID=88211 RepID=A0AAE1EWW5_PETCI|nr:hypothetical protein Pcinc_031177 [Petrolisthes cinctipes]